MLHSMVTLPKSERSSLLSCTAMPALQCALLNQIQIEAKKANDLDAVEQKGELSLAKGSSRLSETEKEVTEGDVDDEDDDASTNSPPTSETM